MIITKLWMKWASIQKFILLMNLSFQNLSVILEGKVSSCWHTGMWNPNSIFPIRFECKPPNLVREFQIFIISHVPVMATIVICIMTIMHMTFVGYHLLCMTLSTSHNWIQAKMFILLRSLGHSVDQLNLLFRPIDTCKHKNILHSWGSQA